jgi:hypothetical protein
MTGGTPMIVRVNVCGDDEPELLVATTVYVSGELSAFSGVPLNVGEEKFRPAGRPAPDKEKFGVGEPTAWKWNKPNWPTVKVAEFELIIVGGDGG